MDLNACLAYANSQSTCFYADCGFNESVVQSELSLVFAKKCLLLGFINVHQCACACSECSFFCINEVLSKCIAVWHMCSCYLVLLVMPS